MTPLAKTDGITLEDHTRHVREEAARLLSGQEFARPFVLQKYHARTGRDLLSLLDECALWHDEGKLHPKWQSACQLDYAESKRRGKPYGENLKQAGVRHEMESLVRAASAKTTLPFCGFAAIAAHHGKLGKRHEDRWNYRDDDDNQRFLAYWKQFQKKGSEFRTDNSEDFEKVIAKRYEFAGPRALLQLADHRASAQESGASVPPLRSFSYEFPHKDQKGRPSYRGVQQLVAQVWDEPFAILRAPTGAGKTDAALRWAQHQIEAGRADRLIIAMPTRFTANALSINVSKTLSATGLYHSSAWFQSLQGQADGADKRLADKELELARLLETPITVTTLDHLCICLTGAREDHHGIFWGLAHGCVVIDEADFYDDFTQRNLLVLLRALKVLDVRVLLMSATVPESARELYALSGLVAAEIHQDTSDSERIRCHLKRAGKMAAPDDIEALLQRALPQEDGAGEPMIIYANTVTRAQEYRRWFARRGLENEDVVLYHSRFTEPHKAAIEERLSAMLGPKAWKDGTARGVAILTQIGELSVNISADVMISDLCPIDRLAQRAGRLARFQGKDRSDGRQVVGELFLVEPQRTNKQGEMKFYPAPYGHFRAGSGWETTETLRRSDEWLQEGDYSARRFVELVDALYPSVPIPAPHARDNQRALEDHIAVNWLIVPQAQGKQDDDHTHIWKSRDIAPQQTVYAACGARCRLLGSTMLTNDSEGLFFRGFMAFREWALSHAIQAPVYEVQSAQKAGALEAMTISIGEDTETLFVVRPPFYDTNLGLHLSDDFVEHDDDTDADDVDDDEME